MTDQLLKDLKQRMKKAEESLEYELGGIRAGRANASLVDRITVNYYGADTPLNQMANISVPEARVLLISPYDKSTLGDIETAIQKSDIGIPPSNDGDVIRLVIPALTEERRKEIAKRVGQEEENAKIAIRNIRRDGMDSVKKSEKNGDISEDERHRLEDDIQKLTDEYTKRADKAARVKEDEILGN
ncbi:ribosome recycling factor [Dolosigranulum pigrum]|uniref:ribosome recycling factor n=1 Tax=Dolosigranulum pigrum TaxID=29394 RepID=UPI001AD85841|nr:ribosome recycling factor [Dolosigranulum pigrum]QTJ41466.1 ribosome recycling factor [Dolosigranulum pigrum]QTJ54628.1 ribosome recycling factor [Dolosigranulum pigrum]